MNGNLFEINELESYLGDFVEDYDIEAIIDEATEIDYSTGKRYWKNDIDLAEICERNEKGQTMTKFRLTIGEDGTAWGKQVVLTEFEAENAFEFAKDAIKKFAPDARYTKTFKELKQNCWVDAGAETIPIPVCSLNIF